MKNMTPKVICQLLPTAGHTIQIDDNAKTAPTRCVHVLPCSLMPQNGFRDEVVMSLLSISGAKLCKYFYMSKINNQNIMGIIHFSHNSSPFYLLLSSFYPIHSATSFLLVREMMISGGVSPFRISLFLPLDSRSVAATCSRGTMNLRFTRINC